MLSALLAAMTLAARPPRRATGRERFCTVAASCRAPAPAAAVDAIADSLVRFVTSFAVAMPTAVVGAAATRSAEVLVICHSENNATTRADALTVARTTNPIVTQIGDSDCASPRSPVAPPTNPIPWRTAKHAPAATAVTTKTAILRTNRRVDGWEDTVTPFSSSR